MAEVKDYFETCKEIAQGGVAAIAAGFSKPDDDFMPSLIYIDGGGKGVVMAIDNSADDEDQADRFKSRIARFMEARLRQDRALAASLMMSVWYATAPLGTPMELAESGRLKPSRMVNRREMLWLQVTDGNRYEVLQAPLLRHPGAPPTVGEWKLQEQMKNATGRFQLHNIFRRALGVR